MTLETLTTFIGWCLVVNLAFYIVTAAALITFKGLVGTVSSRFFGVDHQTAMTESFAFLGRHKLLVIVFFLAPYVALKLMA